MTLAYDRMEVFSPMTSIGLLQFVDHFKHAPRALEDELVADPSLRTCVMREISARMADLEWPQELKSPEAGLLGLLGLQIGGIQNPILRRNASDEFFRLAAERGFSRAKMRMICSEAGELENRLRATVLSGPPDCDEGS
jgi:hypothetical protein